MNKTSINFLMSIAAVVVVNTLIHFGAMTNAHPDFVWLFSQPYWLQVGLLSFGLNLTSK